jgi:hypothetical protein
LSFLSISLRALLAFLAIAGAHDEAQQHQPKDGQRAHAKNLA